MKIWRNATLLRIILPVVYTKQNQKLTWAIFSTLRVGSHVHLQQQLRSKNNFLSTWPGFTEQLVHKYLPKYEATAKGHIRKSFKRKQSTQPRGPSGTLSKNPTRTHIVYLQATDLAGNFTRIKPAGSPSHPAAATSTSWWPMTKTWTQFTPNPWKIAVAKN